MSVPVLSSTLPLLTELSHKLDVVPPDIFRVYGCLSCSWRNTIECPYYDKSTEFTKYPIGGICDRRKAWLLVITPDYTEPVTVSQWKRDFMLSLGSLRLEGELKVLQNLEDELRRLPLYSEDKDVRRKINTLDTRIATRKRDINHLWGKILQFTDAQVDRETPKKLEVQKVTLKPSDVAAMLKTVNLNAKDVKVKCDDGGARDEP